MNTRYNQKKQTLDRVSKWKEIYELTENSHKITVVNYLNVDKIYKDLFKKLGGENEINK